MPPAILVNGQQVWPGGTAWAEGIGVSVGQMYIFDGQTWVVQTGHVTTLDNAPGNGNYWVEYAFARGTELYDDISVASQGQTYGTFRIYWGADGQWVVGSSTPLTVNTPPWPAALLA